jgi:heat shock protein 1/8
MTRDNHLLGKFDLEGIPPAPRGVPQIDVTFDLDANGNKNLFNWFFIRSSSFFQGILHVTAEDKSTGRNKKIQIKNDKGRLSQAEIQRMINEAEQYREEDEQAHERVNARNRLEAYTYSCKQAIENYNGSAINNSDKSTVINACAETQRWLDQNQLAEKPEIEHQYKTLEQKCQKIMTKMHSGGGGGGGQQYGRHDSERGNGNGKDEYWGGPRVEEVD